MAETECPFCGYKSPNGEYAIQLHIEEHHTEDSPFVAGHETRHAAANTAQGTRSSNEASMPSDMWTKCTRPGCGQYVPLVDADEHIELHEAEEMIAKEERDHDSANTPQSPRKPRKQTSARSGSTTADCHSPQKLQKARTPEQPSNGKALTILDYFSGTSHVGRRPQPPPRRIMQEPRQPGRLGKRELGPHAFEKAMPDRVYRSLVNDGLPRHVNRIGPDGRMRREAFIENETSGLVSMLSDLCAMDPNTQASYFCDPNVKHIARLRCDGNFCGYWNIQMVLSHIHGRDSNGNNEFRLLPNVVEIQETVEQAWNNGICTFGRIETGGIRGTRKWIGSHETVAYFTQTGVNVEALSFQDEVDAEGNLSSAVAGLLDHVEAYFMSGLEGSKAHKSSRITSLSPIYFQCLGHSVTIVGLERKHDGSRNLLVFDSSFATSDAIKRLLDGKVSRAAPETLLKSYRRSDLSLSRWDEFEIVVPQPWREPQT